MKEGGIMEITLLDNLLSVLTSIITITPTFTGMASYVPVFIVQHFKSILIVSLSFLGKLKERSVLGSPFLFCLKCLSNSPNIFIYVGLHQPYLVFFRNNTFFVIIPRIIFYNIVNFFSCIIKHSGVYMNIVLKFFFISPQFQIFQVSL